MKSDSQDFYEKLNAHQTPLAKLLLKADIFKDVPACWFIVITDIKSSTAAVKSGAHENVNLIATGSIATVLNIAFSHKIRVPFFFGGDGATFIVPPALIDQVMESLFIFKANTLENYGLELRTGKVNVGETYKNHQQLKICKYLSSTNFTIPIVIGNGLSFAEKIIKGDDYEDDISEKQGAIDLSGMQCRWDKISPPVDTQEVISLIVTVPEELAQQQSFSKVIALLDQIYGSAEKRQPISVAKLIFRTSFNNMRREMMARLGEIKMVELIKSWIINLYGKIYFKTKSGQRYLMRLVEMSDTLVIDGRINTVITGTAKQRLALQKELNKLEESNEIVYGIFVSTASVMSCYVRDLVDDHIHFVDGAEGGYTKAAGMLKAKLKR